MAKNNKGATSTKTGENVHITTVSPRFKLVFITVLCFTAACLVTNVLLAVFADPTKPAVSEVITTCSFVVKAGFGAMIGLLGGKAL